MKILKYLNNTIIKLVKYLWGVIRDLYNRMGPKLKFAVWLAVAASIGWVVYDMYPLFIDTSTTDVLTRTP